MEKSFEFAENVVGFMVNTEIDHEKMEEILNAVKERIEKISPVSLYLENESSDGISIGALLKALAFHFSHSGDLQKIAIVTDDKMFHNSMEVKDLIVPAEIKAFERKDRLNAMNWVVE